MPTRRSFVPVSAIVLMAAAATATGAPAAATPPVPGPPTDASAWTASLTRGVTARSAPRLSSRAVARVDRVTAFWRRPQRLLVLSAVTEDAKGEGWVRVRLPERPNRASGFVPVDAVKLSTTALRLRVSVSGRRVEVLRAGRRIASYRAAVGTDATPTPTGLFAIQDPVPSSASQKSYLGPYILTLTAYSSVLQSFMGGNGLVAIHGTSASNLLGQAVSNGCIRIDNAAVTRLYGMVRPGTPVEIVP
jgi:lipoprotein-anchoring transpeptidase ErfK/SrfK